MIKRNILLVFLGLVYSKNLFAQDIIVTINGVQGNRPLTVDDFKGKPDGQSIFDGNTCSEISYTYKDIKLKGHTNDTVFIAGITVKVEMYLDRSWIKKGKEINYLLNHEQGHFNVKRLWAVALTKDFDHISLPRNTYQKILDSIFSHNYKKFIDLDILYDKETNHSKNKVEQEKWNKFFNDNLPG